MEIKINISDQRLTNQQGNELPENNKIRISDLGLCNGELLFLFDKKAKLSDSKLNSLGFSSFSTPQKNSSSSSFKTSSLLSSSLSLSKASNSLLVCIKNS